MYSYTMTTKINHSQDQSISKLNRTVFISQPQAPKTNQDLACLNQTYSIWSDESSKKEENSWTFLLSQHATTSYKTRKILVFLILLEVVMCCHNKNVQLFSSLWGSLWTFWTSLIRVAIKDARFTFSPTEFYTAIIHKRLLLRNRIIFLRNQLQLKNSITSLWLSNSKQKHTTLL